MLTMVQRKNKKKGATIKFSLTLNSLHMFHPAVKQREASKKGRHVVKLSPNRAALQGKQHDLQHHTTTLRLIV